METLPTDFEMWKVVAAVFLPLLIAVIQKQKWSGLVKAVLALVCCILIATGDAWVTGQLGPNTWRDILVVFFIVVTTYKGFWKPTGIAPSIEKYINK